MKKSTLPGLAPPLPFHSIFCIGRNYQAHAKELNNPVPKEPVVFLKPLNSICFDGASIKIPSITQDVHHEVELVVAIGKKGSQIPVEEALNYVSGYAIGIDFTARDLQQKAKEKGLPWALAKGMDGFAALSTFVPAIKIPAAHNLTLQLSVNSEIRQNGTTANMIFSIPYLIHYLSTYFTLYPGDLIFTGTPEGVAQVKAGDTVNAVLEKYCRLSVKIE